MIAMCDCVQLAAEIDLPFTAVTSQVIWAIVSEGGVSPGGSSIRNSRKGGTRCLRSVRWITSF
jgi:hypothetical protein